MKKVITIILIAITIASCGSTYSTCPAYGYDNDKLNTTKVG
jgi:PBP1b-binding outer membrane lipoprotein LpoB